MNSSTCPGNSDCRILVLGVGNILLRDEGVGVRAVEALRVRYRFSANVELLDGGTQGLKLLGPITEADRLIVVDALKNGDLPGTMYRLEFEDLGRISSLRNSLHEIDLVETLSCAELLGSLPRTVIIGVEPEDISPWGTELSERLRDRLEDLLREVLREIERAGGRAEPNLSGIQSQPG
jgi:hydrogenase maturation protease